MPDLHVLPIADLREHEESRECWCGPSLEHNPGCPAIADDESDEALADYGYCACERLLVIRVSLDGRELIEQHGLQ